MAAPEAEITYRTRSTIGVSRDDRGIGYAVRIAAKPERWTAWAYATPIDLTRTGCPSAEDAAAFIAAHGTPRRT